MKEIKTIVLIIIVLFAYDWLKSNGAALPTAAQPVQFIPTVQVDDYQLNTETVRVVTSTPFPTAEIRAATAQPVATLAPLPTYTPPPTYTAVPLLNDHGLPSMGPYTLQQVETCTAIIFNGQIDTLPSPQRELCEQYVNK